MLLISYMILAVGIVFVLIKRKINLRKILIM